MGSTQNKDAAWAGALAAALSEHSTVVQPDDTLAEAGRKVMLGEFVRVLAEEEGARTGADIEHVHNMRVSIRRIRSAFALLRNVYRTKPIKAYRGGLRVVMDALGEVRDLDVMIHDLTAFIPQLPADQVTPMQSVVETLDQRRTVARMNLVQVLDSKKHRRFYQDFGAFLSTPGAGVLPLPQSDAPVPHQVRHALPPMIYERLAEVRAYDAVLPTHDIPTLHQLRITFKRLRYTVSLFDNLLGPEIGTYVDELKKIQDYLGRLNDIAVAHERLEALMTDLEGDQTAALWLYLEYLDSERPALVEKFPKVWARFNARSVQRKLALSVVAL